MKRWLFVIAVFVVLFYLGMLAGLWDNFYPFQ